MQSLSQTRFFSSSGEPKNKGHSTWKRYKKLNSGHPKATLDFFKSNPHYEELSDFEKIFAEMFWTKRFCNHSVKELSEDLGMDKTEMFVFLSLLEAKGLTKPEKKFRVVNGEQTNSTVRTHKPLTRKGKKLMKAIVKFAWKGVPIPESLDPGIVVIDGIPKLKEGLRPCDKKKLEKKNKNNFEEKVAKNIFEELFDKEIFENKSVKKVFETANRFLLLRNKNKKNKLRETDVSSPFSTEKKEKFFLWTPSSFDSGSGPSKHAQFITLQTSLIGGDDIANSDLARSFRKKKSENKELMKKRFKNSARRKVFQKYGLLKLYDEYLETWQLHTIEREPLKKLSKVLKHLKKKVAKHNFKPKNLVAFFVYLMNNSDQLGFCNYMAKLYYDAINHPMDPYPAMKRLRDGMDTGSFIRAVREMEVETSEKLSKETLARMLARKRGAHLWLKAIEAVKFRMNKFGIDSWVGLWVYAVNLGSVEAIKERFYTKQGTA